MSKKKQTINTTEARKYVNKLIPEYNKVVEEYDKLAADVLEMNEKAWSGGKRANKGYQLIAGNYERAVGVVNNLKYAIGMLDNYITYVEKTSK